MLHGENMTELKRDYVVGQLKESFAQVQEGALDLLKTLVNIESGSRDKEDVDRLGAYLKNFCEIMGGQVIVHEHPVLGNPISVSFNCGADSAEKRILLVCHRDTVFPHGTVAERPFSEDDKNVYGPGCADMKGGIVDGLTVIKVLNSLKDQIPAIPIEIIFTSDEEIGSEASQPFVAERAKNAIAAFFLEPARADGSVVIGRNGGDLITIKVKGRSSHAGNAYAEGRSAIHALAKIVADISKLEDEEVGYSANVGTISGGEGAIIVAPEARAQIYTRFSTVEQKEYLVQQIRALCEKYSGDGIEVVCEGPIGFLPFVVNEANTKLFDIVKESGKELGWEVKGLEVRGAADAGITSCLGVPTICGMGPVGGELHTDREYAVKESFPLRQELLALSIIKAFKELSPAA